jgi:hypothetical protein
MWWLALVVVVLAFIIWYWYSTKDILIKYDEYSDQTFLLDLEKGEHIMVVIKKPKDRKSPGLDIRAPNGNELDDEQAIVKSVEKKDLMMGVIKITKSGQWQFKIEEPLKFFVVRCDENATYQDALDLLKKYE